MGEIAEKKRPYAIRIFCEKPISDLGELLEEFLINRVFFDEDLKMKQVNSGIEIQYETGKSPVRIEEHRDGDKYFNEWMNDILFVLNLPGSEKKKKILEQMKTFGSLLVLKIQREELTDEDDVWEFLDVFESFIATRFDGMIHTDDLVFYDKNLKKVYRS
jgi:hypothetical protein